MVVAVLVEIMRLVVQELSIRVVAAAALTEMVLRPLEVLEVQVLSSCVISEHKWPPEELSRAVADTRFTHSPVLVPS
jgi:hypothetical protein